MCAKRKNIISAHFLIINNQSNALDIAAVDTILMSQVWRSLFYDWNRQLVLFVIPIIKFLDLVGLVTPPFFASFCTLFKGHRGYEVARLGLVKLGFVASVAFFRVYKNLYFLEAKCKFELPIFHYVTKDFQFVENHFFWWK